MPLYQIFYSRVSSTLLLIELIGNRTSCHTVLGKSRLKVQIMQLGATPLADLKSLAQLLTELYSTQSYHHY